MSRFTKVLRQRIVREFAIRHNGTYNPALFVEEVRRTGPSHQAYDWFEWNRDKAALQYQVEQARSFARDLRVTFTVQVISGGRRSVKVRESEMPLVLSPIEGRKSGTGYVLVDTENPDHMAEHCAQAAMALRAWLGRYRSAAASVGASVAPIEELAIKLDAATPASAAA